MLDRDTPRVYCTRMADAHNLLDPDIAALAANATMWLCSCFFMAGTMGVTAPAYIAAQTHQRVHTGYAPEAQRRATRHLSYSNGLPVVS